MTTYQNQKLETARKLAEAVDHLNPKCLSLGAGMMAHLQQLAKEFLDDRKEDATEIKAGNLRKGDIFATGDYESCIVVGVEFITATGVECLILGSDPTGLKMNGYVYFHRESMVWIKNN